MVTTVPYGWTFCGSWPSVGGVVEEGVSPGEFGKRTARLRHEHERAGEVSYGRDDLFHTHGSSMTFKCLCGVGR